MSRSTLLRLLLFVTFTLRALPAPALTYYVDGSRPDDNGDGRSWAKAKRTLQAAIDADAAPHEVWAKKGVYAEAIQMKSGVALYGGFGGSETRLAERNPKANATVIDGSRAAAGLPAKHVVTMNAVSGVTLSGFTVRGGRVSAKGAGGGIYCQAVDQTSLIGDCVITSNTAFNADAAGLSLTNCKLRVSTCTITRNAAIEDESFTGNGGGVAIYGGAPTLSACLITDNQAENGGGAYISGATGGSVAIERCQFTLNEASYGGGLYFFHHPAATLSNTIIKGDLAHQAGGGLYAKASTLTLSACELCANGAVYQGDYPPWAGGGMLLEDSKLSMLNCLVFGNHADRSANGGGLYLIQCDAAIAYCTFARNFADNKGGAMDGSNTKFKIEGSIICDNQPDSLNVYSAADVSIKDTILFANESPNHDHRDFPVALEHATSATCSGDPRLGETLAGFLTGSPQYNPQTRRSTLAAANAAFTPGALTGRVIMFNNGYSVSQAFVTANSATTIQVAGDLSNYWARDTGVHLVDPRPGYGSAALDAITTGPATDCEGAPRPVDLAGLGANRTKTEYDLGADELIPQAKPSIQVRAAAGELDFGIAALNAAAPVTRKVTIRNNGFAPLQFTGAGFKVGGANAAAFALAGAPDLTPLAPGAERTVTVQFKPAALVRYAALLTVSSNDPVLPVITLGLHGDGVNAAPVIKPEPPYTAGAQNTIAWAAAAGARSYTVQCGDVMRFTDGTEEFNVDRSAEVASTTLSYTLTGLSSNRIYWYRVRSGYGSGVVSAWSALTSSTQVAESPSVGASQAEPPLAQTNETTTLTFNTNRYLNGLSVTVNGHPAYFVRVARQSPMSQNTYTYRYTMQASDPPGYQRLAISGADYFGKRATCVSTTTLAKAGAIYVSAVAPAGGDGSSWAKAWRTIGQGMRAAAPGNPVWVAAGRYTEALFMNSDKALYGGFSGVETRLEERDPQRSRTWIDVSKARDGLPAYNALHFSGRNITVDGFWITGACADRCATYSGAVVFFYADESCQLSHCVITGNRTDNQGCAGINIDVGSPRISDCVVAANTAPEGHGGGVRINAGDPTLERCLITGNRSYNGGGIYCLMGRARLIDCVIANNETSTRWSDKAYASGAGVLADTAILTATRTLICGNVAAGKGGGIYSQESRLHLANCAISGNAAPQGAGLNMEGEGYDNPYDQTAFVNCTFSANAAPGDGALHLRRMADVDFINVIFASAGGLALLDEDDSSQCRFDHCLFESGGKGLYRLAQSGQTLTTAAQLAQRFAGSAANRIGATNFLTGLGGYWSAAPTYDAATSRTTFLAGGASFTPGALVGRVIDLGGSLHSMAAVTSNTALTIQVAGDQRALASRYAPFQLLDLRPGYASAAIDTGTSLSVPMEDASGSPRPVDIAGHGASGAAAFDSGAYEAQPSSAPRLIVTTGGRMDFGGLAPDASVSAPLSLTVRNLGFAPLNFTGEGIAITGTAAGDFAFATAPVTTTLAPGASRAVTITFRPTAAGPRVAFLTITSSDPQKTKLSIPLTGYRALAAPVLVGEPALTSSTWNMIDWGKVAGAHDYTAQCCDKADFASPVTVDHIAPDRPYCKFTGLLHGKTYWYRVRANDSWGQPGLWSKATGSTQDAEIPQATIRLETPSPTLARTAYFRIYFYEPMRPFTGSDIAITGLRDARPRITVAGSGSRFLIRVDLDNPQAWGNMGLALGAGVRDLAGNPAGKAASPLCRMALPATVVVRPVPADAGRWILTNDNGVYLYNVGAKTVGRLMPGAYQIQWLTQSGWETGANASQTIQLADGQVLQVAKVMIPQAPGPRRDRARVLEYLLGLNPNPAGLDADGDGRVTISDLLYHEVRITPNPPIPLTPSDYAHDVSLRERLEWTPCLYARTYDLYLWRDGRAEPAVPTVSGLTGATCPMPPGRAYGTTYHWRIVAHNVQAQTAGAAWTFTTESNPVHVLTPLGGEVWRRGVRMTVRWTADLARAGSEVRIELWRNGARAAGFGTFLTTTTSYDSASVRLPDSVPAASGYRVRIISTSLESAGTPIPWDESDGTIEIK